VTSPDIAVILPSREGFTPHHFGAIALCVHDFVQASRYAQRTIIYGTTSEVGFPGLHYRYLPMKKRWWQRRSSRYFESIWHAVQADKPALIEVHNRPSYVHQLIRRQCQSKLALHLHNDPQSMKGTGDSCQRRHLLKHCAAIYCVSDFIRQRFLEGLEEQHDKVHVVYNGFSSAAAPQMREKQITFIGRLRPEKGAREFVEALHLALPQAPGWKGVMIGAMRHDPKSASNRYEREIQNMLQASELPIEMRGFCTHEETMVALAASEIAVVPSRWEEPFGRTALESMAAGCATISAVRGGIAEVVGDAAYPLPEVTATGISDAILTLISDEKLRQSYQQHALTRSQQFTVERCTGKLDNIRQQLL
jgi:glycosyltransferase involved in cell wall biosynthesis